jgi:hypothetical protein
VCVCVCVYVCVCVCEPTTLKCNQKWFTKKFVILKSGYVESSSNAGGSASTILEVMLEVLTSALPAARSVDNFFRLS